MPSANLRRSIYAISIIINIIIFILLLFFKNKTKKMSDEFLLFILC